MERFLSDRIPAWCATPAMGRDIASATAGEKECLAVWRRFCDETPLESARVDAGVARIGRDGAMARGRREGDGRGERGGRGGGKGGGERGERAFTRKP